MVPGAIAVFTIEIIARSPGAAAGVGSAAAVRGNDESCRRARAGAVAGEFYVYDFDLKGVRPAYGGDSSKRGENAWDVRDADSKFPVREIIGVGTSRGRDWCDYMRPNPVTRAV